MRIKNLLTELSKRRKLFLILIVLVAITRISLISESQSHAVSVITVREIYNTGSRNISQLHFYDYSNQYNINDHDHDHEDDVSFTHTVGLRDLEGSDCYAAFSGKAKNSHFKETIGRWNLSRIQEDAEKDCDVFKDVYGLNRYPTPLLEELEFPLAFSIIFHKDFDQVLYLLRAVYRPQNFYCLHADKKSDPKLQSAVKAVAKCLPNVFVASRSEDVVYAGYSRLQADLTCMNDSLKHSPNWKYYINMVGQEFPLKSNLEMVRILKLFNGTNDIEGITGGRRLTGRFQKTHKSIWMKELGRYEIRDMGSTNPPPPLNIEVVKGSVFGSFSRAFVEYVMSNPIAHDLLNWSKSVYSPDEYIWATLQHSKGLKVPGGNNTGTPNQNLWFNTYANWGGEPCFGKFVHGICIFTPEDLPLLLSRHEFFANKLHMDFHPGALHCLDKLLYSLSFSNTVTDMEYYRKLKLRAVGK